MELKIISNDCSIVVGSDTSKKNNKKFYFVGLVSKRYNKPIILSFISETTYNKLLGE